MQIRGLFDRSVVNFPSCEIAEIDNPEFEFLRSLSRGVLDCNSQVHKRCFRSAEEIFWELPVFQYVGVNRTMFIKIHPQRGKVLETQVVIAVDLCVGKVLF